MSYKEKKLHEAVHSRLAGWRALAFRHAAIIADILMAAGLTGADINQHVFWTTKPVPHCLRERSCTPAD